MRATALILVLGVLLPLATPYETQEWSDDGELVAVITVYRHGDRTPIDPYPTDPYRNTSYWPVGYGQLTNRGKEQQYELGQWLRERYGGFLPRDYSETDIYIRSTDVDRTLMSAYANLAGLYEPTGKQIWNSNINWQPIPVHTKPELDDYVLAMKKPCDRHKMLVADLMKSPQFSDLVRKNHDLFAYLSRKTGKAVTGIENVEYIYNTLLIEQGVNYTLPDWTRVVFPDKMRPLAVLSFAVSCYNPELARLKTGPLFNEFLEVLHNATTGATKRKMTVYSAHDTTIANVLMSMGMFEYHSPPYASTIIFELRSRGGGKFVNIFYKNTTEARQMKLAGCELDCPYDKFVGIIGGIAMTPQHWHDECKVSFSSFFAYSALQNVIIIASSAMFIMLIASIIVGVMCARPKGDQKSYFRLPDSDETA